MSSKVRYWDYYFFVLKGSSLLSFFLLNLLLALLQNIFNTFIYVHLLWTKEKLHDWKKYVQFTEKLGNAQKSVVRFFVQASNPCEPMGSLHATIVPIEPSLTRNPLVWNPLNSSRSLCLKPLSFMLFPSQAPVCQNRVQFRSVLMAPIWASKASIASQEPQVTVLFTEANVDD